MRSRNPLRLGALVFAGSLVLSGCLGTGEESGANQPVEIFGGITGTAEAGLVKQAVAEIKEATGVNVTYQPSRDFTTLISSKVRGGDAPDIALFPQPGLLLDMSEDITPLGDVDVGLDEIRQTLIPGLLDSATKDGKVYGAPIDQAPKSLVWYPKKAFEQAGYEVPTTHQELLDLTEQIKQDGKTPWCIGLESGPDTGWPATDWLEDYVLRTAGPEAYDQWVAGKLEFSSPQITEAAETVGEIMLTPGNVQGGGQAIVSTSYGDSAAQMFENPPACYLHRQASFITTFFPDNVQQNLDEEAGVFVLPPVEGGYDGTPILGSGNFAALFNSDNENAVKVMEYLISDKFGTPRYEAGGVLSPHTTFDVDKYPDETTKEIARQVNEADVYRFDGSDLMPAEVGTGAFWTGMVDWVSGQKDLKTVLPEIDESWPS
ncbi:MAG: extracellular solute-binding protein [Actinophytocola sp.]|nr:extracellular solute-binding protein [Actinophytocola sp.]